MNQIRNIKGTRDILPTEIQKWQELEKIVHEVCNQFGYHEIRTPVFEETGLFSRTVGENTDIVSKEMYSWSDNDGKSLTLRPELTAPVARSYIQNNLGSQSNIQRLYYMGPLFRRERPQKGRQRQFHQFGIEAFGSKNPEQDAEIIAAAWQILSRCDLTNSTTLNLNSIGSKKCREKYRMALTEYMSPFSDKLSDTSKQRLKTNPLRILDTKSEKEIELLKNAPNISEYYTTPDKDHFELLKEFLKAMAIPYTVNKKLVRGLDYYSNTVFEFVSDKVGAQDALLGGGRYDHLVESIGGKPTPGIGFAAGMERFIMAMDNVGRKYKKLTPDVYFICLDKIGIKKTLEISMKLRDNGIKVICDPLRRSMKSQLREANKVQASFVLILGENEINNNTLRLKDLKKGSQKDILQSEIIKYFDNLTI